MPGHAEIQAFASPDNSSTSFLVPATVQSSGFDRAFAEFDTIETPELATENDGPRFEDPGEAIGGGVASWYGSEFAGRRTASGERFNPGEYTAAHRSLPFGSKVRVTHVASGRSVIVRINDRGPFSHGRVIDLSHAAASEIGIVRAGSGKVSLSLLSD